jgi:hypothetical protein
MDIYGLNIDLAWIAALFGLVLFAALVTGVLALMYGMGTEARLRLQGRKIELRGKIEQARIRSDAAVKMEAQSAQLALEPPKPDSDGHLLAQRESAGERLRQRVFSSAGK